MISSGDVRAIKTNGYWWNSTSMANARANYLDTQLTQVKAGVITKRGYGNAIRCVVREG